MLILGRAVVVVVVATAHLALPGRSHAFFI